MSGRQDADHDGHVSSDHAFRYLASIRDCKACPLKAKCCPNMPHRRIMHDVNKDARDVARSLVGTPEFEKSRDKRKKVEMKFAHLKCHHGLERLRLRGPSGARDEFQLAAIVQNLKNSREPHLAATAKWVGCVRCMSRGNVNVGCPHQHCGPRRCSE